MAARKIQIRSLTLSALEIEGFIGVNRDAARTGQYIPLGTLWFRNVKFRRNPTRYVLVCPLLQN